MADYIACSRPASQALPTACSRRFELPDEVEMWIDTGITSGADIVASIALGAQFTLIADLYGLMAAAWEKHAPSTLSGQLAIPSVRSSSAPIATSSTSGWRPVPAWAVMTLARARSSVAVRTDRVMRGASSRSTSIRRSAQLAERIVTAVG